MDRWGILGGFGVDAASSVMGSGVRLHCFVSQSGKEWFVSHSRRLTCFSRTLEEKCIIHPVDWSLFFSSGWIRERVEDGLPDGPAFRNGTLRSFYENSFDLRLLPSRLAFVRWLFGV